MRSVAIFGATGSIGVNTLDLIGRAAGDYEVAVLTGGRNVALLAEQAKMHRAKLAVTADESRYAELKDLLAGTRTEVAAGSEAIREAAERPSDWTMSAIVGAAGLVPSLTTVARGGALALANKESLVCAGPLLMKTADANGAEILPVDSEHSAIFQCLGGHTSETVESVTITASGGAFRDWPLEKLATASVAEASTHPNFAMGQRITIDSATMFNKAMEVIEAKEFFGFEADQINVVIQREQIIHALVTFHDGAMMAHLGAPDMRHAIGYALHWPERRFVPVERVDLIKLGQLTFAAPDPARYPALALAQEVMKTGGLSGAVFNAAKEIALDHFIAGKIGFTDMARVVAATLSACSRESGYGTAADSLEKVLQMDHFARVTATELIARHQI